MAGVITLKKADFSASNIGKVLMFNAYTKKVLEKQTQYAKGSEESLALDSFINNMQKAGYIGGSAPLLTTLIIPALAKEHSELMYNIANIDNEGYPTNAMSDAEIAASSKALTCYKENDKTIAVQCTIEGVDSTAYSQQAVVDSLLFTEQGVQYPSFSAFIYNRNGAYPSEKYMVNKARNYSVELQADKVQIVWINQPSNGVISAAVSRDNNVGFYGISYDAATTSFSGIMKDGNIGETSSVGRDVLVVQENSNIFRLGQWLSNTDRLFCSSLIAFGNKMTTEQMLYFKEEVEKLLTALKATI